MNPILCVTDFSERALEAARAARALARHWGERVVLVHSVDERGQFPFPLRTRLVQEDWPRLAEEARRLRALGFEFEPEVVRGMPEDGIAAFAWKSGARLIVVGGAPAGAIDRWALGCLPEEIIATSVVPLLAVRDATTIERWLERRAALNIFAAFDPAARPEALLNRLDEWREMGGCTIAAGLLPYPEIDHTGLESAPAELHGAQFRPDKELRQRLAGELAARHIAVSQLSATKHPDAALARHAAEAGAELIVVASHPHADSPLVPHRTLAEHLLRHAAVNVLCVPETAVEAVRHPVTRTVS